MKRGYLQPIAALLSLLLASPLFSPVSAAESAAVLGRIVSSPEATVNGMRVPGDSTLLSGDRLTTGPEGWARVVLARGEQIHLVARSKAQASRQGEGVALELAEGRVAVRTGASPSVAVGTNGLWIAPTSSDALWEVTRLRDGLTRVTAQRGSVVITARNRSVPVGAGQSMRVESHFAPANGDQEPTGPGAGAGLSATAWAVIAVIATGAVIAGAVWASNETHPDPVSPSGF